MSHARPPSPDVSTREVGVIDDPSFDRHRSPGYHPERPERLEAARAAVKRSGVRIRPIQVRPATPEELERVHGPAYLERLRGLRGRETHLDADTYLAPDSVVAAERAAGGAVELVDALLRGEVTRGVALLRPPGHHARPDDAMGFCVLNNVAVAAAHALAAGLRRVAIVDWDVHHGNGTQEMFYDDPRVLYVSLHQFPFYPGTGDATETGSGEGRGFTVNVPLSEGAGPSEYAAAFERVISPIVDDFAPELMLVSAGFDAHQRDPLAAMRLDAPAYGRMTHVLGTIADRSAAGKMALVLEGGYDLAALEASLADSLLALSGAPRTEPELPSPSARHEAEIDRARRALRDQWKAIR